VTARPRIEPRDVLTDEQWAAIAERLGLSRRETQMIRVGFYDDSVAVCARRLNLSRHTVLTYRRRLYTKLRVRTFCQVLSVVFATHVGMGSGAEAKRSRRASVTQRSDTRTCDLTRNGRREKMASR
jgi:DNA-binding CsgD family transcriptional regulator